MKRFLAALLLCTGCILQFGPSPVRAVVDPLAVPNNKFGVHILDTTELAPAAALVNSHGGDWGYVTIPLRSDDRDAVKWRQFFITARNLHLIPIIRLATYVDADTWVAPTPYDLVDFANFLNDMPWPTKNRYVILFNEPNHAQEWGGQVAPDAYARLLVDAHDIFKSRSSDFFLLTAGLDMSAPDSQSSQNALEFYRRMSQTVPDWYASVDGLSFHAYPNPGFSGSPFSTSSTGITSYKYEQQYLKSLGYSGKPAFITETGTINNNGNFYTPAFTNVWTDNNLVAVTPFLLFAGAGPFSQFSLLDLGHQPTPNYRDLVDLPKSAGSPLLSDLSPSVFNTGQPATSAPPPPVTTSLWDQLLRLVNLKQPYLNIGDTSVSVEISDTDATRTHGLSDRPSLPADHGMLFIFPSPMPLSFWMKDMHFPLDFVWINRGRIVELNTDVPPPTQTHGVPLVINPANFADWVLEVNAGFIVQHHVAVGDTVALVWK